MNEFDPKKQDQAPRRAGDSTGKKDTGLRRAPKPKPDLALFESLPAPAILLDRAGSIERCNRRALDLFGLSAPSDGDECPPREDDIPAPFWRQDAAAELARSGAPTLRREESLDTPRGRRRLQLNLQPVVGPGGVFTHTVVLLQDLTEQRRTEAGFQELLENLQRSNQDLEQFAYVASHDLQEPLRMIGSYLQLLERRCGDRLDTDGHEFLHFAVYGAQRMQVLIQDLLAYSRIGRNGHSLLPTDFNLVVQQALRHLGQAIQETGAQIHTEPLPTLAADRTQLLQLFQNLIGNAIKFRGDQPPRITIEARGEDDEWLFSVRDLGIGIDPRFHDRIFGLFQRLHSRSEIPGTGIGLALCKRIVERHGGRIWVESLEGQGADFRFTLKTEPPTVVGPVPPRGSP
jgi:signal transduction histidine kinase